MANRIFATLLITLLLLLSGDGIAVDFKKENTILTLIRKNLDRWHLKKTTLNDEASQRIFTHYIDSLDPGKRYFTQDIITELAKDNHSIDNQILENSQAFFTKSITLFKKQLQFIGKNTRPYLNKPIIFSEKDVLFLDADLREFSKNNDALLDYWRRLLNYQVITKMIDLEKKKLPKN